MLARCLGVVLALVFAGSAAASEGFEVSWATLEGGGFRLQAVKLAIDWSDPRQTLLRLSVGTLEIGGRTARQAHLVCPHFELLGSELVCNGGRFSVHSDWLQASDAPARLRYGFASGRLEIEASDLRLAGGRIGVNVVYGPNAWTLDATLNGLRLPDLARLFGTDQPVLADVTLEGRIDGRVGARGRGPDLNALDWQLRTSGLAYSNRAGDQAGETLQLASRGTARAVAAKGWDIKGALDAEAGALYSDPVYLEFSAAQPLQLGFDIGWRAPRVTLRALSFRQAGVASGQLRARVHPGADDVLETLVLDIEQGTLPGLYSTWLQPWLAGTALGDLEAQGAVRAHIELEGRAPRQITLELSDVGLRETHDQFAVEGVEATLNWARDAPAGQSTLAWRSASLYRLQFGAATVALETAGDSLTMLTPLAVPLFDGELRVEAFEIAREAGQMRWLLDGMLAPVSMQALSQALGWPPLSGTLSGMFPRVQYRQGELGLGGVLLVQAFDGDITLRNLRIDRPLGLVPRLWVDARIDHLDLETLTRAFSFGRIEGRLEGRVDKLYMEAWQPVSFDARLQTPAADDSRHRISQRAVDTISNLGGAGVAGAVSRGFLRFLEDFPYKALGIACRLENGVCHMDGVSPAENGYYLVQGRMLPPRLDVVGFAREVDWVSLIERLKAATSGTGPQVQ